MRSKVIFSLFVLLSFFCCGVFGQPNGITQNPPISSANTVIPSSANLPPADALLLQQAKEEQEKEKAAIEALANLPQGLVSAPSNLPNAPSSDNLVQNAGPQFLPQPQAQTQTPAQPFTPQPSPNLQITPPPSQPQIQSSSPQEQTQIQTLVESVTALEATVMGMQKQFEALNQYAQGLEGRINKLEQELQKVEVSNQSKELEAPQVKDYVGYFFLKLWPKQSVKFGVLALIALIFLAGWRVSARRSRKIKKNPDEASHEKSDTEAEYDFMQGATGIDARLNLARAYVAMDKKQEAHNLLEEILVKGDDKQKKEAENLIRKIS